MISYDDRKTITAASQIILGLVLFIAPWGVGFANDPTASWTAWLTGGAIALTGLVALATWGHPAAWVNLVLGAWAVLAPWILGFAAIAGAMWSHVALGVLVALAAAIELWAEHQSPSRRAHA